MNDPFNQLPTDPDWASKVDALTKAASKELGCMVLLVALQENGKVAASLEGVPQGGELAKLAEDVPGMLITLASVIAFQEDCGRTQH